MSPLLQSIKTQYENTYNLPAFDSKGQGNIKFMETLVMSNDKHKRNFIEAETTYCNRLAGIHEQLEK